MWVTLPALLHDIPGHLQRFEVSLLYQLHQPVRRRASASISSGDTVPGITKPAARVETKPTPHRERHKKQQRVAQRKRGGPITHRSQDRNLALILQGKIILGKPKDNN
ncbi:hypothetical protein V6N11_053884 [Hibiscus sabdariffa]|uniref:DUF4283 domain-containing protein n=1 Tax=Hibiscus sabdariffa TaxID=183260 RepID=A0ABR2S290_9ROSI